MKEGNTVHEHSWTWQWFGLYKDSLHPTKEPEPLGLRTCSCGAFEKVKPTLGKTPEQEAWQAEAETVRERKRQKMREYIRRRKEAVAV